MNNPAFGPAHPVTPPHRGPLAGLLAQLTGAAPAAAPAALNGCQCISPPVPCNLVAGFTGAYDPASNRLFERHLHAECRSHLYPAEQYDSADRLLQYQRGLLAQGGAAVATPTSLPGSDAQRAYALDLVGNWQNTAFTPACGTPQTQQRMHNALNQITQDGTTTPFAYDGSAGHSNGNLADDGVRLYAYDALNRLRTVRRQADGALIARYTYDVAGRRDGGLNGDLANGATDYVYAGWQCLAEFQGGQAQREYVAAATGKRTPYPLGTTFEQLPDEVKDAPGWPRVHAKCPVIVIPRGAVAQLVYSFWGATTVKTEEHFFRLELSIFRRRKVVRFLRECGWEI